MSRWIRSGEALKKSGWGLVGDPYRTGRGHCKKRGSCGRIDFDQSQGYCHVINDQLNTHDIQVVSAEKDGSLVIGTYNRFSRDQENGAHGIYRIETDGKVEK
ncbi:hypothetical protein PN4B1_01870 [Paenibacillus naphthalenovorans]|uniref:hypothetical protein n=1 Tax=Paenibacillus naphthalenovorans TaxID=162209 RepID=UPI0010B3AFDE|nr:hypothetical protein [Paenibacillus naphthalenovorans]GCL70287.1 hypothetical protein PN4B1_01870 [Paenibacillus naphthalenovorans]